MNQSETDLGIVNESQLLGFGISCLPNQDGANLAVELNFYQNKVSYFNGINHFVGGMGQHWRECGVRPGRCLDRGSQEQNAEFKFAGFSSGFRGPHRCAERPRTACRGKRARAAVAHGFFLYCPGLQIMRIVPMTRSNDAVRWTVVW